MTPTPYSRQSVKVYCMERSSSQLPSYGTKEPKFIFPGITKQEIGIRWEGRGISGKSLCEKKMGK